jgi:hypothetical protein
LLFKVAVAERIAAESGFDGCIAAYVELLFEAAFYAI